MQWLKNGKLVEPTNRRKLDFKILSQHETLITLFIGNLKEKDFEEYECLAVNKYGRENQKVQITCEYFRKFYQQLKYFICKKTLNKKVIQSTKVIQ